MSSHTQTYSSNYASTLTRLRKVAIPRLQLPKQEPNPTKDRQRVQRACNACRSHKIKCSGDTPQCKHCKDTGRGCVYTISRTDRLKIATQRCVELANLLDGLRNSASEEDNARITALLEQTKEDVPDIQWTPVMSKLDTVVDNFREYTSSVDHHAQIDTNSLDIVDENLQKDDRARATGFVGRNSEVQWLRTVGVLQAEHNENGSAQTTPERRGRSNEPVCSYTYWMDSEGVDPEFPIDPYELPTPEMAERLLSCYMTKVHNSFPILPRKLFEDQFRNYFKAFPSGNVRRLDANWQAILNLVFAIGSKYSHLTQASWADERDHLVYQARARALGLNETALANHPDVPRIQVMGLLAFYWLSIGQASRAWVVMGMALRFAYALGLHVRNEDFSASAAKRERLVRTWWSLYSLERQLSIITGRPSTIVDSCCSVPLPLPIAEDQITDATEATCQLKKSSKTSMASTAAGPTLPTSSSAMVEPYGTLAGLGATEASPGSYFKALVQLGIITQSILTSLYSAGTMIRTPNNIQQTIHQLGQHLDQWAASLPTEFNFQSQRADVGSSPVFARECMILGLQFCSARILLTRPCLSGLSRPEAEGVNVNFMKRMAKDCLEAARMAVDFLPEQLNPLLVYEHGPWWNIVHYLMQAVSVFLLGLSLSTDPQENLVRYAKKVIRWLRTMQDPLAERAYHVAFSSFESVASGLGLDMSDLWIESAMAFPNPDALQAEVMQLPSQLSGAPMSATNPSMSTFALLW